MPGVTYFKPAGVPIKMLDENCLSVEEIEAIRLRDLEHLEQQQCAEKMKVSRPTFQRVLLSARKKVADSLIAGKALRINGGNYELEHSVSCPASESVCADENQDCPKHYSRDAMPACCPRLLNS
jgi:predicted DNA-binding protein (UPF0251 family)